MRSTNAKRTLIQCDFDGTITTEDASFILLDEFADGDWKHLWRRYEQGKISVGHFNRQAFAMVKADKQNLLEATRGRLKMRAGFQEFVAYCHGKGYRLVIVSNGLDFYIEAILRDIGMEEIEVFSARTQFHPEGLQVQYIGPDDKVIDDDFKKTYVSLFLESGYRVIYIGNGASDIAPAKQCHRIFATDQLLAGCHEANLDCTPFTNFHDIVREMELL